MRMSRRGWCKKRSASPGARRSTTLALGKRSSDANGIAAEGRANMSKHFITGAARSVTNSVERLTELRKNHPEWDDRPSEKALARERLLKPRSMPLVGSPGALVRR